MNLNINGDIGQKRILWDLINNRVLGSILIEFNFSQQDNICWIYMHVISEFYVSNINIYYRKLLLKKNFFIEFFASFRPQNYPNKLIWQIIFIFYIVHKPALSLKKSLKNIFAIPKHV